MRVRPREVESWSLARVAAHIGAHLAARSTDDQQSHVSGIALTTKATQPGDLFIAVQGTNRHGAEFAGQAQSAGAAAILTDVAGAAIVAESNVQLPMIVRETAHLRAEAAGLSAAFYGQPSTAMTMIGITGTQGKTTSTYLAEAAVGVDRSAVIGTIGTRIKGQRVESELTTPEAPALQALFAVMREEQVDTCAMEVSSHALVQGRVGGFRFDTAVFLNLGRDHLDFHTDMDDYFAAKARLFTPDHAVAGVVNVDDEWGRRLVETAGIPVRTFSTEGRGAHWRAVNIRPHRGGTDLTLLGPGGIEVPMTVPLAGVFNVSNAVAVVAAAANPADSAAEPDPELVAQLAAGIATSPGVPGRMERLPGGRDFEVVIDYAHKPEAITAVVSALRPVTAGRLIVVIGAGGDRDHGKRPLMGQAAAALADVVVVTDDNPRSENPAVIRAAVLEGARGSAADLHEIGDRREAIGWAIQNARRGDTIVIAGKGHETGQIVGGVVHPFDDREVAATCVAELS